MSEAESHQGTRRDFIYYATAGAGAVATGAAVWPLINQMNPSADVLALASIRQDISAIQPGSQAVVLFQGKPVFFRRRTEDEIALAAEQDADLASMPDQLARNENIAETEDASDANRAMPIPEGYPYVAGEWLVQSGVCTHLGCVPIGDGAGEYKGWFCPCHGSHYDASGRIRKGPAPENLPIPVAIWIDETTIQLGEEA